VLVFFSGKKKLAKSSLLHFGEIDYRRKTGGIGYCSPVIGLTATGKEACLTPCESHGYDYFWCRTQKSWDYCGKTIGVLGNYGKAPN